MSSHLILIVAESYLLGAVPFGLMIYRLRSGGDLRSVGSGNIGATNVLRCAGTKAALATLLLDAGKGAAAVLIAGHWSGQAPEWMSLAALLAIAGHVFPVYLKFRGGKGVATAVGAFLALAPFPALISLGIFLLVIAATRYVSLGSVLAVAAFPWILIANHHSSPYTAVAAFVSAGLIIARHHANIGRLIHGTERQIDFTHSMRAGRTAER